MTNEVQCTSPSIWPLTSTSPSALTSPLIFNPFPMTVPPRITLNMRPSQANDCLHIPHRGNSILIKAFSDSFYGYCCQPDDQRSCQAVVSVAVPRSYKSTITPIG